MLKFDSRDTRRRDTINNALNNYCDEMHAVLTVCIEGKVETKANIKWHEYISRDCRIKYLTRFMEEPFARRYPTITNVEIDGSH